MSSHEYRVTPFVEYALGTIDMGAILRGREGFESVTLMTLAARRTKANTLFARRPRRARLTLLLG